MLYSAPTQGLTWSQASDEAWDTYAAAVNAAAAERGPDDPEQDITPG